MITVEQIVAAQHRDIEQAQQALSARAVQTTRDALARVDRQLRRARPGSWTQAEAVATRAQLRMGLMTLAVAHQQDLAAGLPPIMRKAQQRAAQYLGALDERYLGAVRANDTPDDVFPLPASPAVSDAAYFGAGRRFGYLEVNMTTPGVGVWTVVWEYWDGASASGTASAEPPRRRHAR